MISARSCNAVDPYIFASLVFSVPRTRFCARSINGLRCDRHQFGGRAAAVAGLRSAPVPGPGYVWTPGYWAYNNVDYYWVPGTWVEPPQIGYLWTPAFFHRGYWASAWAFMAASIMATAIPVAALKAAAGTTVSFFYNRAVTNVTDTRITNVYDKTVVINENSRISYNGGRGGREVRPTAEEEAIAREPHMPATRLQTEHLRAASVNGEGFASLNHGRPAIAATARPGDFKGPGVLPTRAGHHIEETGAGAQQAPTHGTVENHMDRHNGAAVAQHEGTTPGHEDHLHRHMPGTAHESVPAGRLNGEPKPMTHAAVHETAHRPNTATMHGGGELRGAPRGEPGSHGAPVRGGEMHAAPHPAPEMHGGGGMHGGEMHGGEMRGGAMHAAPGGAHGDHPGGGRHPEDKR